MQASLDVALPYATQRKQFGKAIGEFQLVAGKLADMYTVTEASRAYLYNVAAQADAGGAWADMCVRALGGFVCTVVQTAERRPGWMVRATGAHTPWAACTAETWLDTTSRHKSACGQVRDPAARIMHRPFPCTHICWIKALHLVLRHRYASTPHHLHPTPPPAPARRPRQPQVLRFRHPVHR
jgi:hypothetical protein